MHRHVLCLHENILTFSCSILCYYKSHRQGKSGLEHHMWNSSTLDWMPWKIVHALVSISSNREVVSSASLVRPCVIIARSSILLGLWSWSTIQMLSLLAKLTRLVNVFWCSPNIATFMSWKSSSWLVMDWLVIGEAAMNTLRVFERHFRWSKHLECSSLCNVPTCLWRWWFRLYCFLQSQFASKRDGLHAVRWVENVLL